MLDLEGVLRRWKMVEDGLVVAADGSGEDGGAVRRRFGKKNPSGSRRRWDWREASLSDVSGVVPERRNAGAKEYEEKPSNGGSIQLFEIGRASCRERVFNWV